MKNNALLVFSAVLLAMATGCNKENASGSSFAGIEVNEVGENNGSFTKLYVLNEGAYPGASTLDLLDFKNRKYCTDIFAQANPEVVQGLGNTANDMLVADGKLWVALNASNQVVVLHLPDAKLEKVVDVESPRYLLAEGGYVYVTSYAGAVYGSADAVPGKVYRIDRNSYATTTVEVGYQPEEMVVVGGKLYVANSGGYIAPQYDRTISVIDLATMSEERQIDVAVNLHRLRLDRYGQLWVSSRGNSRDVPSKLYWLKTDTQGQMQVAGHIDIPVSDMCIVGDSLYFYGADYNAVTYDVTSAQGIIDVQRHALVNDVLSNAPEYQKIRQLYGIIVHPRHRDFYLMDAKNYVSSGELLHFNADGTFDYKVRTGDIPGHAAFLLKVKK